MTPVVHSDILSRNINVESRVNVSNSFLTPIVMGILIFLITALVGVWAAPDRSAALNRFALFIVGVALIGGITWGAKRNVETTLGVLGLVCSFLAVGLTVHYLLTVNWAENEITRFPFLQQIGLWLNSYNQELSELQNLHKNITGGLLVILFPFSLGGTIWAWSRNYKFVAIFSLGMLLVILLGLIMSISRGAWLGFGFGTIYGAYFYWRFGKGSRSRLKWVGDFIILTSILLLCYGFLLIVTEPQYKEYLNRIMGDSVFSRADLWLDSLPLIQDYWYSGSGLGSTTMVYSSYVLLLHVPYLAHAHNLFLQIALEQGIPGLITFVFLIIFTIWGLSYAARNGNSLIRLFCALTTASIAGLVIHGMVEAGIYAHQLVPVMFLPFGFAIALISIIGDTHVSATSSVSNPSLVHRIAIIGGLAPSLIIVLLFLWPGSSATLQANLGAVAQTRAELAIYHWPEWPIQDELRRNQAIDLTPAINHYKTALSINPDNLTALRRLGQIEISLGNYDAAQHYLEAAYRVAPDQRATRQMLGEIYAINGNVPEAIDLWQPLDLRQGQLDARQWWYYHIGSDDMADLIKQTETQLTQTNQ